MVEVDARNEEDRGGVSGFVLMAQSHLSLHAVPRRNFVSADIFTCRDRLADERIRQSLIAGFGLDDIESGLPGGPGSR